MDEGRPPDPEAADAAASELGDDAVPTEDVALVPRGPSRGLVAIAVVLVAALVVFAFVGGRIITTEPVPTARAEPRLAVTDAGGKLYTMNADGKAVTDFPAPGVTFGFPAWSPDGTRIAVTGQDEDSVAVYVFDAAGGGQAAPRTPFDSPDHPPFYLYWSPDGRQIAFLTTEPDGIALRVAPADAGSEATVVRKGAPFYWDWLGSDHLVAHIGLPGADSFLGEVDLEGASSESEALDGGYFRSPAVSHDGAYRAYVTTGQDSTGIVTLESADRSSHQSAPVFGVAAVAFDPTGGTLAYVGAERPTADDLAFPLGPLRALDPATGKTRTLLGGQVVGFFWSPDGTTIAALTIGTPGDEVVGVPGAGLVSAGGPRPGAGGGAPQAGVGLTLAFVDVASGSVRAQRATEVTSAFVNNILPYYDQYALSHRMWAPDSSAVALPLDDDGTDRLFVIPADGSSPHPLEGAQAGFWSP
jgi:TolB protein